MSVVIGVDPGLTGAIAIYSCTEKKVTHVYDMPLLPTKSGNVIDREALARIIGFWKYVDLCVIEKVHSMPDQGVASTFKFGFVTGLISGIVAANNIPVFEPPPAVWKSLMGVTSDKETSLRLARKMWPDLSERFKRKKDNGRAEAALLAAFGAERFISQGEMFPKPF